MGTYRQQQIIALSMRLSEAQSGALEQSPKAAWLKTILKTYSLLHLAYTVPSISGVRDVA
jgi:hypothetical protein